MDELKDLTATAAHLTRARQATSAPTITREPRNLLWRRVSSGRWKTAWLRRLPC